MNCDIHIHNIYSFRLIQFALFHYFNTHIYLRNKANSTRRREYKLVWRFIFRNIKLCTPRVTWIIIISVCVCVLYCLIHKGTMKGWKMKVHCWSRTTREDFWGYWRGFLTHPFKVTLALGLTTISFLVFSFPPKLIFIRLVKLYFSVPDIWVKFQPTWEWRKMCLISWLWIWRCWEKR